MSFLRYPLAVAVWHWVTYIDSRIDYQCRFKKVKVWVLALFPYPTSSLPKISPCSPGSRWIPFWLQRAKVLGLSVQLVSKISNLCDYKSPTSQTEGQTDGRHATPRPRICTKVHCAVKMLELNNLQKYTSSRSKT